MPHASSAAPLKNAGQLLAGRHFLGVTSILLRC
jgi:hypothetical protein